MAEKDGSSAAKLDVKRAGAAVQHLLLPLALALARHPTASLLELITERTSTVDLSRDYLA